MPVLDEGERKTRRLRWTGAAAAALLLAALCPLGLLIRPYEVHVGRTIMLAGWNWEPATQPWYCSAGELEIGADGPDYEIYEVSPQALRIPFGAGEFYLLRFPGRPLRY